MRQARAGLVEVLAVWALYGLFALTIVVTYARLPPEELYNVDEEGLKGGAGRALVFLNYSTALAAIAVLGIVRAHLPGRAAGLLAATALALCAIVGVPGVVEQSDLDAKPVNALPAVGVGLAFGLTLAAIARAGLRPVAPDGWDAARVALGAVVLLASLPWIAAELGFFVDDVPGLGAVFSSDELYESEPSVHKGHHHGMDGGLLVWTALALTRPLGGLPPGRLRAALAFYLGLMLVYGLALALEDFWLEQIVKRGVTVHRLPSMIRPDLSPAWAALLVAALVVATALGRLGRVR